MLQLGFELHTSLLFLLLFVLHHINYLNDVLSGGVVVPQFLLHLVLNDIVEQVLLVRFLLATDDLPILLHIPGIKHQWLLVYNI